MSRTVWKCAGYLLSAGGFALAALPLAAQSAPAVRFSGYFQARESWQEGTGLSTSLNRVRAGAAGAPAAGLTWKLVAELRTGSVGSGKASASLQDAYARYQHGIAAVQVGQFKTPFTREYLISITDVETPNRALAVDALAPKRDLGVMGELGVDRVLTLSAGIFNGDGINLSGNRDSTPLGVGRLTARPVADVELGANVAGFGGDSLRYGGDVSLRHGRLLLRGEYLGQRRDGGVNDDAGWYALAGLQVHPALQLVGRYEVLKQGDGPAAVDARAWTAGGGIRLAGNAAKLLMAVSSRRDLPADDWAPSAITQLQVKF